MKSIPQVPFCDNCPIKVSSIFKDLTQEQLDTVHLGKGCSLYKRGNIIYHEGHRISGFYCIQSGVIKVYKTGWPAQLPKSSRIPSSASSHPKTSSNSSGKILPSPCNSCSLPAANLVKPITL